MDTPSDRTNYYMEPVEIEIYFKKAGTVKTIVKELFIELVDEIPKPETGKKIFSFFKEKNEPIDIIEIQNNFPEVILPITVSYFQYMELYEKLNLYFRAGIEGSIESWRHSLYLTELLIKFEPTLASLEFLGDFHTANLNFLIRKLNSLNQQYLLEDSTVEYLITRKRKAHEGEEADKEFDKLVELWEYNLKEKLR